MAEEDPDYVAPEGATCAEHRDRVALFKCPRCGRNACLSCFHAPVSRCVTCMRRDPTEASPPLPFEAGDGTALGRFFRTFGTAFYPWRSAPAFARPGLKPAVQFFLLSSLPLILLSGIIPFTRTLWFADFKVFIEGKPSTELIALDVARAIAVQVGLSTVELLSLLLPFTSLVAAYAPERKDAATRLVLYRFWLGPLAALLAQLAAWSLPIPADGMPFTPEQGVPPVILASALAQALMRVFQLLGLIATSRLACGLSVPMSMLVVGVPLVLQLLVLPLSGYAAEKVLPPPQETPSFLQAPPRD